MLPITDRLINDLTEKLVRDLPELEEVILFGSRARGDFDMNADVDLILVVDEDFSPGGASRWEYVKKVRRAQSPFPMPIDFRVYSQSEMDQYRRRPSHIVSVALGEGRTLFRRIRMADVA